MVWFLAGICAILLEIIIHQTISIELATCLSEKNGTKIPVSGKKKKIG
jgi:hypothetical protein